MANQAASGDADPSVRLALAEASRARLAVSKAAELARGGQLGEALRAAHQAIRCLETTKALLVAAVLQRVPHGVAEPGQAAPGTAAVGRQETPRRETGGPVAAATSSPADEHR